MLENALNVETENMFTPCNLLMSVYQVKKNRITHDNFPFLSATIPEN